MKEIRVYGFTLDQLLFLGEIERIAFSPIAIVGVSVCVYVTLVDTTQTVWDKSAIFAN